VGTAEKVLKVRGQRSRSYVCDCCNGGGTHSTVLRTCFIFILDKLSCWENGFWTTSQWSHKWHPVY